MNRILVKCTVAAALGGLLFGYDTVIINGAISSIQSFFALSPSALGLTVSSALVGCLLGSLAVSKPSDIYGSKIMLLVLSLLFLASSIGCGMADRIETFILFRFMGGLAIGGASVICPVYISEISPPKHRGFLASTFQLSIVTGILLSLVSNYFLLGTGDGNWRWMMFSGALPALLFFILVLMIVKSPRWLVKKGRMEEAARNIELLSSHEIDTEETIRDIRESIRLESEGKKVTVFKKPYRRIILIGIMVGIFSQLTGIGVVFYYSSKIFAIAGFSDGSSMAQSVILGFTNLIFTLIAMAVIDKAGRKKLLLTGQAGMVLVLFLFGYGLLTGHIGGPWLVVLLVAYIAFFASSVGVVIWVILSEMFPNLIRARGASLGSFANWAVSATLNFLFPVVVGYFGASQAQQQKGMGYTFIFLALLTFIGYLYQKTHLVETKGKTLEQIEKEVLHH